MKVFLENVYEGWLQFAELVGRFNTKVIVTIIYWFLMPLAWFFSNVCLKRQLLDRVFRDTKKTSWLNRPQKKNQVSLEQLRHQF